MGTWGEKKHKEGGLGKVEDEGKKRKERRLRGITPGLMGL